MKIILLASVPHTGTIFLQQFVEQHPEIGNVVGLSQLVNGRSGGLEDPYRAQRGMVPGTTNLVWTHIQHQTLDAIRAFHHHVPTIIPLRDPLLSLITAKKRREDAHHVWIVENWLMLRVFIWPYGDAAYYPVDLESKKPYNERRQNLHKIIEYCGLPADNYVDEYAHRFQPANSRGEYELKTMYKDGDFAQLRLHLKKEIEHLQANEDVLRPMLEEIGYKDLLWWS